MDLQEIDVFIDKNGQVRVEVRGVKGMSCLDVTRGLEAALGGQVIDRQWTAEAYQTEQATVSEQQQQRSG
ncbi:MAG TPA: DUF2997 domain-containing protein [Gemmataceae bacterium]|nr:DUF2997 domain-containing protein [Gemmataceae bacterium]